MRTRLFAAAGAFAIAAVGLTAVPAHAAPITCQFYVGPVYTKPPARQVHQDLVLRASHVNSALVAYTPTGQTLKRRLTIGVNGQPSGYLDLGKAGWPAVSGSDLHVTVKGSVCSQLATAPA